MQTPTERSLMLSMAQKIKSKSLGSASQAPGNAPVQRHLPPVADRLVTLCLHPLAFNVSFAGMSYLLPHYFSSTPKCSKCEIDPGFVGDLRAYTIWGSDVRKRVYNYAVS